METTSRSRNRQKENEKGKKEKALFPEKREGIGSEREENAILPRQLMQRAVVEKERRYKRK